MNKQLWIILAICAAGFFVGADANTDPVEVDKDAPRGWQFKNRTKCAGKTYRQKYVKCVCDAKFQNCKPVAR